jgi:hypothetical protein
MRIKTNFFDSKVFEEKLSHLNHIDFSLFVECMPQTQEELSPINILAIYEPNEYFGLHDWAIVNKDLFNIILTWDDKVLNNCDNALFTPFGHSWLKPDQYEVNHSKSLQVSHLCGNLLKSYGHQMRHELMARENEIKIPTNFYQTIGDRHNIEDARKGKETVFKNSMFGAVIENFSHRGFFTEKILDCFLLKTIPIYWGCTNINEFFNKEGLIEFGNIDDFIYLSNILTEEYYNSKKDAIEENYQKALQYIDYEQTVVNKIIEVFKLNNII